MKFKKEFGFTLIELIMVIVILGILAAVAIPKFFNLSTSAKLSAEEGAVGGIRAGIQTYMANDANHKFPNALDSVAVSTTCSTTDPCFVNVLAQGGITSVWATAATADNYLGPTGATYVYTKGALNDVGSFVKQ